MMPVPFRLAKRSRDGPEGKPTVMSQIVQIDEAHILHHLGEMVRETVDEDSVQYFYNMVFLVDCAIYAMPLGVCA